MIPSIRRFILREISESFLLSFHRQYVLDTLSIPVMASAKTLHGEWMAKVAEIKTPSEENGAAFFASQAGHEVLEARIAKMRWQIAGGV